jgi:LysR family transcriptional regulator, hypochlorite-specific transcription factor HypT
MNIKLLHDFLCVADTMNLTASAEARNTTQPNLSKRIRQLEAWLGRDLIDRRNRPFALTKAGEDLVPIARSIVTQLEDYRAADTPHGAMSRLVSIAMPHSATFSIFPAFKQRIARQVPKASFATRLANHDVVARMLARSECDLALAAFHPATPQAEEFSVLKSAEVARERLVIVASPDARDEQALPLHISHRQTYIGQIW